MKKIELIIDKKTSEREIKSILFHELELSSRMVTKLKNGNGIMLNGQKATVRKIVHEGDILSLTPPDGNSENIIANNIPLDIVYEDDDLLVLNKPHNMPTHPSINHYENTLANGVMYYYRNTGFTFRAINRLDRDTTGLVLIAKNPVSANKLSNQLKEKRIQKTYLAISCGEPEIKQGSVEVPIRREAESVIKRITAPDGQYAKTDYKVLKVQNGFSLLELFPVTGRTHQIRVHMAHIGIPLYGDFIYGTEIPGERTRLHSYKLKIIHPSTNEPMEFYAKIPDDFFLTPTTNNGVE